MHILSAYLNSGIDRDRGGIPICFFFFLSFSIYDEISIYSLPWQGLKAATKKQKYDKICEKKLSTPIEVCLTKL